jgi:hypothetical protein
MATSAELIVAQVIHKDDQKIGFSHDRTGDLVSRSARPVNARAVFHG